MSQGVKAMRKEIMKMRLSSIILLLSLLVVLTYRNVLGENQLTERQALDILAAQIQKDKLYDSWAPNLSCFLFLLRRGQKSISPLKYMKNTVGSVQVIQIQLQ